MILILFYIFIVILLLLIVFITVTEIFYFIFKISVLAYLSDLLFPVDSYYFLYLEKIY